MDLMESGQLIRGAGDSADKVIEARARWHVNAPILYDYFVNVMLEWPALCVAWLPDVDDQLARLAFGTNTGGAQDEVVVCEIRATPDSYIEQNPWKQWNTCNIGEAHGFGLSPCEGQESPLATVTRLRHPTEVNRLSPCPHRPQLLATKAASGAVLLFDYQRERDPNKPDADPDATLRPPNAAEVDGFALTWSTMSRNHLASGGNDGRCCLWDVNMMSEASLLHDFIAHDGALCEVAFSHQESHVLASVGDDRALHIWDIRASLGSHRKSSSVLEVSGDEVLTVDWNYQSAHLLATSGKDHQVRVWDLRALKEPWKLLSGHSGECVAVRWSPRIPTKLASCSRDSSIIIWDLEPKDANTELSEDDEEDDGSCMAPEILFKHSGHTIAASDFSWTTSDCEDGLLCSVDDGGALQIWGMRTIFDHADVEDDAADDLSASVGICSGQEAHQGSLPQRTGSSKRERSPLQKRPRLAEE